MPHMAVENWKRAPGRARGCKRRAWCGRELRPGGGLAPVGGGGEIGGCRERGREGWSKILGERVEAVNPRVRLGEIDGAEAAWNEDRHAPRAGERCGAGGEDRTVIQNDCVRGREPEPELLVGQPGESQHHVIEAGDELLEMRGVGGVAWLADDRERGVGPRRAPVGDDFLDLLVRFHGSKHQTHAPGAEAQLLRGFRAWYWWTEARRKIAMRDDVNAVRRQSVGFDNAIPRRRRMGDDRPGRGENRVRMCAHRRIHPGDCAARDCAP